MVSQSSCGVSDTFSIYSLSEVSSWIWGRHWNELSSCELNIGTGHHWNQNLVCWQLVADIKMGFDWSLISALMYKYWWTNNLLYYNHVLIILFICLLVNLFVYLLIYLLICLYINYLIHGDKELLVS